MGYFWLLARITSQASVKKLIHSEAGEAFRRLLVEARKNKKLTQVKVAAVLKRPQSFVEKVEQGERRLDVIEFIAYADALGVNRAKLFEVICKAYDTNSKE